LMSPNPPIYELVAACEQLADDYARALTAIQELTSAALENRLIATRAVLQYEQQAEKAAADLKRFRALVAAFRTMLEGDAV
jgi:hypothetical protein